MSSSELPTCIVLFHNHAQFINALAFCQDNDFDVVDTTIFGYDAIAIFENHEIACLVMLLSDDVCYFQLHL
jgi:hypothetical protein